MTHTETLRQYTHRLRTLAGPGDLPPVAAAMATVALLAWTAMLEGWLPMPMPGPETGPMSAPGVPEAIGTSNGGLGVVAYLAMVGVMMVAMMYPAMLPYVRRYASAVWGSSLDRAAAVTAFLAAYSSVWALTGVVPLAIDVVAPIADLVAAHGSLLLGGNLLLAGGYQFTAYKQDLLDDCCARVPNTYEGPVGAFRRGIRHGLQCIRCTWPLMATMVVAGTMNAFWMLVVTFVVAIERHGGTAVATTVGLLASLGGVAVLLFGITP